MSMQLDQSLPKSISEIMAYQNPLLLARFERDFYASREEAQQCFHGLKQFFVVCTQKSGYKVVSEPIDRMWHTFLLFTKDYREFCNGYLGRFIDHAPFETPMPSAYLETRAVAEKIFGQLDPHLWSTAAKIDCSSSCIE